MRCLLLRVALLLLLTLALVQRNGCVLHRGPHKLGRQLVPAQAIE